MNSEAVNVGAVVATVAAGTSKEAKADEFAEFANIEIVGGFRGYWRDVADRNEDGQMVDKDGNVVDSPEKAAKVRRFKISRQVKRLSDGGTVRHSAWLTEADTVKLGLQEGVKYQLKLSVLETLTPDKNNGKGQYLDEYFYRDVTVLAVNGKVVE